MEGQKAIMLDFSEKAAAKRAAVFRNYQLKLIEKISILKWQGYNEEYFFLI